MPMRASIAAVTCLLSACATSPAGWEKSSTPRSQLDADKAQCQYEAEAATASYKSTPSEEDRKRTGGMGAAVGDGVVIAEKRVELTNACMKARGYSPSK